MTVVPSLFSFIHGRGFSRNVLPLAQAFIDQYQRQPGFDMSEFEQCREVARALIDEYKAAETDAYPSWTPPPRPMPAAAAAAAGAPY